MEEEAKGMARVSEKDEFDSPSEASTRIATRCILLLSAREAPSI